MRPIDDQPFLQLHPDDDVVIARRSAPEGTEWVSADGRQRVTCREAIDLGHKLAIRPVAAGQPVRKYGQLIGYASQAIEPGEWVHLHNLGMGELSHDYEFSTEVPASRLSRSPDGPSWATAGRMVVPPRETTSASSAR